MGLLMEAHLLPPRPDKAAGDATAFWAIERKLLLPFWIPNTLYLLSYGAGLVALPLFMLNTLRVPYVYIGGYKVAQELAELAANNPSAWAVGHFGWRGTLAGGGAGFALASLLLLLAAQLGPGGEPRRGCALFLGAYFLQCGSMKFFNRGSGILTAGLSSHNRGRHSNLQAGLRYITTAVGPWAAGAAIAATEGEAAVFTAMVLVGGLAFSSLGLALVFVPGVPTKKKAPVKCAADAGYGHFLTDAVTIRELCTVSAACLIIVMLRGSFNMMVPLQGSHLGLSSPAVALTFVWCNACGFSLFWVGGLVLDRLGRRWSAVPACALFGAAFILLGCATGALGMHAAAVFFGFGETISGGIKRSLKADFTDRAFHHRLEQTRAEIGGEGDHGAAEMHKARFAAMIDNALDSVGMLYPIALASIAQVWGPPVACFCFGGLGVAGSALFGLVIGETLRKEVDADGRLELRLQAFLAVSLLLFAVAFAYLVWHASSLL